ncbi:hypothetical protein Acr_24g0005690 [Actinidia rufa]|uniref:Uncharacterized protein n=1 Tax=Actinidia rufa TaxID=165716 RepID=A0A7J0GU70_9ERIC|nr:hypothetical protein Acr_24g0005690 [Actinidia rufa]
MGESNQSQRRLDGLREFGNKISHEYLITYAHIEESEMGLLRNLWPNRGGPAKGKGQSSFARFVKDQRATTRPVRGQTSDNEATARSVEGQRVTGWPVRGQAGDDEACHTQIELIPRGHREARPVVLKSNFNRSISRTSSVQQPSRRRLVNVRRR